MDGMSIFAVIVTGWLPTSTVAQVQMCLSSTNGTTLGTCLPSQHRQNLPIPRVQTDDSLLSAG